MKHQTLAEAAAVLGAAATPVLLLASNRFQLLGGLAAWTIAEVGLAYALVPDAPGLIVHSATRITELAAAGAIVLVLAAVFVRFPAAIPLGLLLAAPFRVSVELGNQQAYLLLPLYGVLVAALGALGYRAALQRDARAVTPLVAGPAAALVALAGLSFLWTRDPRAGAIELVFFYFPFSALLAVVARSDIGGWTRRSLTIGLLALTTIFAAIGIFQAWTHTEILAKQTLQLANARASFFRVTSVFQDPSVYGRQVVVGLVVTFALLWLNRLRPPIALPVLLVGVVGLYFSYSQTSELALFAGIMTVALIAGDRLTRLVVGGTAVGAAIVAVALVLVIAGGDSARSVTSDRSQLARITLPVYTSHPVAGVGIGSQPFVSRREAAAHKRKSKNVSHTTPLTIAAEMGTIGLLAYAAFLIGLGRALLLTWQRHRPLALALAGSLTALFVHSLSYGGFFEDPTVWGIAALAAAALGFFPTSPSTSSPGEARGAPAWVEPMPVRPGSRGS